MIVSTEFTCFTTKRKYKLKGILKCERGNLASCKCCENEHVGSATGFKERFRIHKSEIKTGKARCGVVNHLFNVCLHCARIFEYLHLQLMKTVSVKDENIGKVLLEREKHC